MYFDPLLTYTLRLWIVDHDYRSNKSGTINSTIMCHLLPSQYFTYSVYETIQM